MSRSLPPFFFLYVLIASLAFAGNVSALTMSASALAAQHDVGNDGSAQYSIPLNVPAGVQGMQPSAGVAYSSNGGNGVVGVGFDITGLSSIHRCATTIFRDGYKDGVNFDDDDQFCLDGQRLIAIDGEYGASGTEYRTEYDNISRIVSYGSEGTWMEAEDSYQATNDANNPLWFKVWTKDGRIYSYGATNNARASVERTYYTCQEGEVLLGTPPGLTYCYSNPPYNLYISNTYTVTRSYEWRVNHVEDRYGNKMVYSYNDDDENGEYSIDRISYNYVGSTAKNYVQFTYENRNDKTHGFFAGGPIQQTKRLTSISAYSGANVKQRELRFSYTYDYGTGESRLQQATECVGLYCVSPTSFYWGFGNSGFSAATIDSGSSDDGYNKNPHVMDVNGDGRDDFVQYYSGYWRVMLSNGGGLMSQVTTVPTGKWETAQHFRFDDDLKDDLLVEDGGEWKVLKAKINNNAYHTINYFGTVIQVPIPDGPSFDIVSTGINAVNGSSMRLMDVDGDARKDLVYYDNGHTYVHFLGKGANGGFGAKQQTNLNFKFENGKVWVADFNGDGLDDVLRKSNSSTWGVYYSQGGTTFKYRLGADSPEGFSDMKIGDVNSDGLPDMILRYNSKLWFRINNGVGFNPPEESYPVNPMSDGRWNRALVYDYNADGKADILYDSGSWAVLISDGVSLGHQATAINSSGWNNYPQVGDVSGNGMNDLILAINNTWQVRMHINERPNYLERITNGFGVETEFYYRTLNDPTDPLFYDRGNDVSYPLINVQNASYLVSDVRQSDGVGGKNSTSYRYKKMLVHQEGLGNLGFEQVTTINNDTNIQTTSTFSQDYGNLLQGTLQSIITSRGGVTLSETANEWVVDIMCDDGHGTVCEDEQDDVHTSRYLRGVEETTVTKRDLSGYYLHHEVSSNPTPYEIYYGPNSADRVMVSKIYSTPTSSSVLRSTTAEMRYDNKESIWLMGMLRSSTVTTVPTAGVTEQIVRKSEFDYDTDTGRKTEERIVTISGAVVHKTKYGIDENGQPAVNSYGQNLAVTVSGLDFASRTTKVTYDATGRYVVAETNALGQTTTHEYLDANSAGEGLRIRTTDPNGLVSAYAYDVFRRLRQSAVLYGTANQVISNTYYNNCSASIEHCEIDANITAEYYIKTLGADGSESHEYFDVLGRTLRKAALGFNPQSEEWTLIDYLYDSRGNNIKVSEPYTKGSGTPDWNDVLYDDLGRPVSTTTANGRIDTIAYSGSLVTSRMDTLGKNQWKTEQKDPLGNLVAVHEMGKNVSYRYDALGNITELTANSSVTQYIEYDELGRKVSMDDPDKGEWSYTYNGLGELITQTNARGETTCMAYDKLGRMVKRIESYTGSKTNTLGQPTDSSDQCDGNSSNPDTTVWIYDTAPGKGIGKLHSVASPNGYQKSISYDAFGRVAQVSETIAGDTYDTVTTYDALNRVDTVSYPSKPGVSTHLVVQNIYNNRGYLSQLKNAANTDIYYTVSEQNARGNVTEALLGNGLMVQRAYEDATGYMTRAATHVIGTEYRQRQEFVFDILGNLELRKDHKNGIYEEFSYDDFNRLVLTESNFDYTADATGSDVWSSSKGTTKKTTDVEYDSFGNIVSKTGVGTYRYGSACTNGSYGPHAVCKIVGGSIGTKDTDYAYDPNGNMLSGDGRSITWSAFDKPLQISQNGNTTNMSYGADRQLITRTDEVNSSTTSTVYVGGLYEKVTLPNGDVKERHYVGGSTIVTYTNRAGSSWGSEETRYLHKDHLGSVVLITNEAGNKVESFSFDAWGKRRAATLEELESILGDTWTNLATFEQGNLTIQPWVLSSSITNKGFTGHEQLDSVNLIHMGGRVYDAEIGRFLSADPFVQDTTNLQALNRYSYVQNNPLSYTDPSGYFLKGLVKKIGKAIGSALDSIANGIRSGLRKIGRIFADTPGLSAAIAGLACGLGGPAGCVMAGKIMMGLNAAITAANGGTMQQIFTDLAVGAIASGVPGGGGFWESGITGEVAGLFSEGAVQSFGAAMFTGGAVAKARGEKFVDGVKSAAIGAAGGTLGRLAAASVAAAPSVPSAKNSLPNNSHGQHRALDVVLDIAGKIWTLPNTLVGAIYGGLGYVAGMAGYAVGLFDSMPTVSFNNNAIQFHNNPFTIKGTAITIGNTISYSRGVSPSEFNAYGDPAVNIGLHEKAHTYQYQKLGPLFLPVYLMSGGISGPSGNKFEQAAQDYGANRGGWWPK